MRYHKVYFSRPCVVKEIKGGGAVLALGALETVADIVHLGCH